MLDKTWVEKIRSVQLTYNTSRNTTYDLVGKVGKNESKNGAYTGNWMEKSLFPAIYQYISVNSTREPAHGGKLKTV